MPFGKFPALALLAIILALSAAPTPAGSNSEERLANTSTAYAQLALAAVERWERLLYGARQEPMQITVYSESLLERLTWLYEVDKLQAALPRIRKLLSEFEVKSRFGFSHDGSVGAVLSLMELKSPAFNEYMMFLVNIENRSAFTLDTSDCQLAFTAAGGKAYTPEAIERGHPLFEQLERLVHSFVPPASVAPGATASFKVVLAAPKLCQRQLSHVLLELGGQSVMIKFYDNLD